MKKLLILGDSYGALEIAKTAKKLGLYVIATDYTDSNRVKKIADESWKISTGDVDTLEQMCRSERVDGIINGVSGFNLKACRELCRRLGFPVYCSSDRAVEVATNKYEFKKICKELGAPIAEDYDVSQGLTEELLSSVQYPVVVKPIDSSASRGMSYCFKKEELISGYEEAIHNSKSKRVILERMLHGPEFAVNYLIADGEPKLFFISSEHHQPGEPASLYSIIMNTTIHLPQYMEELNEKVIQVFRKAELTEGVAWVECMRDTDGHFYLLEMGYRFGSEIVNIPYRDVSGFDSVKWMIECAMSGGHHKEELDVITQYSFRKCAASYSLFINHGGLLEKLKVLLRLKKWMEFM